MIDLEGLFRALLAAPTEDSVEEILKDRGLLDDPDHWTPYGDNESFYGVVENQQAHPVPALVEKVTNGIDAILEKKVLEDGIDPRSEAAPRSVGEALDRYFPDHRDWDLRHTRRDRARDLQIVASGPKLDTSLLVYDDGVGQTPEDFPRTFLSLLRGNKNEVHFVQGKYNMGGAGAIAFCGDKRYQLVASRRYDRSSPLGFTLLRRHPPELAEAAGRKNTWYEYLVFGGSVASVDIDEIDVGLEGRIFTTGSLLKLYSYRLPAGARSIISRDLNRSLNEFLFEPAIPFLTVDNNERYPDNTNPVTAVYGLKRRLEADDRTIEAQFSLVDKSARFGELGLTVYVFKARSRGQGVKETKRYLQNEFFSNGMSVLFSLNGQVHGNYTSEFVSRGLKMPLLKDYVLIHVDCSRLHLGIRNELFMASRDRLKAGEVADELRRHLRAVLADSELKDISKRRKASLSLDDADTSKMLREVSRGLPLNEALTRILRQTFDLPDPAKGQSPKAKKDQERKAVREPRPAPPFDPKRYPSFLKVKGGDEAEGGMRIFSLPAGGSRSISFATDVENDYFDRSEDPGALSISVARPGEGGNGGGDAPGAGGDGPELDVLRSSPKDGTIRIGLRASGEASVGQMNEMTVSLSSPEGEFEQRVLVRITDPERTPPREKKTEEPPLGLPDLVLCSEKGGAGMKSWSEIEEASIAMDHGVVVYPLVEDDKLSAIYINVDSTVLKDFRGGQKSAEASELAERRYVSAVYFHMLFLFATTKSRRYGVVKEEGEIEGVELADYLSDVFSASYAQFLLNFDTADLLEAMS